MFSPPALAGQITDPAGVQRVLATWLATGNTPHTFARSPGIANTDLAVFKNFTIKERLTAQFRAEAYNVFNQTQFTEHNMGLKPIWDRSGTQPAADFGSVTEARDPRIMRRPIANRAPVNKATSAGRSPGAAAKSRRATIRKVIL
jgi:hypothetical protein